MSAWRRTSLELLPECRTLIEASESPLDMWIELHFRFDEAMRRNEMELARRFLRLAAWCVSEEPGALPNDTSTAAAVAFYEHLPQRREYWQYFRQWFSRQQFEELMPVFSYHLGEHDIAELKRTLHLLPNKRMRCAPVGRPTCNGKARLHAAYAWS